MPHKHFIPHSLALHVTPFTTVPCDKSSHSNLSAGQICCYMHCDADACSSGVEPHLTWIKYGMASGRCWPDSTCHASQEQCWDCPAPQANSQLWPSVSGTAQGMHTAMPRLNVVHSNKFTPLSLNMLMREVRLPKNVSWIALHTARPQVLPTPVVKAALHIAVTTQSMACHTYVQAGYTCQGARHLDCL